MPAGATVELDTSTGGTAIFTFTSPADLPAETNVLVNLAASIPTANASNNYGRQQVLDLHDVTLTDASANSISAVADDAVHLVSYFADVSGNGRINAADAAQVARVAALIDGGFAATLLTDPGIVGDVSGNSRLNAADASLVAQVSALIEVPQIPGGVVIAGVAANDAVANRDVFDPALLPAKARFVGSGDWSGFSVQSNLTYPAVDRAMAELDRPITKTEELRLGLEEAIDELLAASRLSGGQH